MLTDIEIAQQCDMLPIAEVAKNLGIDTDAIVPYGRYKAKLPQALIESTQNKPDGKLILVTAITPTPAGEGKTTTTVGLGQGLAKIGKKAIIALREPSLGPVFGVKGGAAGGGYAQVVPMEDINLHFTGDIHAITAANNLLSACIDNSIHQGNPLSIDSRTVTFRRVMDINDRALRNVTVGLGGRADGVPREDKFFITVASEVMAILCLSADLADLKERLSRILIGYTYAGEPVAVRELGVAGAMAALLKDAIDPNLVQTLEGTPALMHGGPFANIAHGCNSARATGLGLKLADYCVTEAGFGSDLGAQKFFDIKCRAAGLTPSCVVLVATARALKYNGGVDKRILSERNIHALEVGLANLGRHIANMKKYGLPVVVALNRFPTDREDEIDLIGGYCRAKGVRFAVCEGFAKGGEGAVELANEVCAAIDNDANGFKLLYESDLTVQDKIEVIAREIYGADGVDYAPAAAAGLKKLKALGAERLQVCIAKTQYSLSDNPALLGAPEHFRLQVREIRPSLGAGFVVAVTGDIMTMPGLPKAPAALSIDIDSAGNISGLF